MLIFPAIDIINGKVVRLEKGNYSSAKSYSVTPLEAAAEFYEQGAKCLHIVDLDGAKSGKADNAEIIEKIARNFDMFIEVGGGIRTFEQIQRYVDCGVKRVILGTAAVLNTNFLESAVSKFSELIAVGVDAKDEMVAIKGWEEVTQINSLEFCKQIKSIGVTNVIYTDISRDGMMNGANLEIYKVLRQTYYPKITASGGITRLEELKFLKKIGVYGAILGKSLYENRINLCKAIELCED
ncbi:MAG: 1-(5-phosphoribosyl)-5-[(5-phosphoribosylamino)methylideneamino]imidazole-4-carboxamide isomerase [Clostridia bacterium]|nr:1-(5-phosphoribosyl)-5-[(5-phosphoribosylamino)methylideneamino]imidazole-4-carboxamide isomerase [Clostridia bacterium]